MVDYATITENIYYVLDKIFEFMEQPVGGLPFSFFEVFFTTIFASLLAHYYRKVMGDD